MVRYGLNGLLYPDIGHLEAEHKEGFNFAIRSYDKKLHLEFNGPRDVLDRASLDRLSSAGTSVVAGLIYAPEQFTHTRELVHTVLSRSDVMSENPETNEISIVFQGGARISDDEYRFAKEVSATVARHPHAPKKFITGGGRGIMRAPHSGAVKVATERGENDTTSCGMSCGKIIAAEPPNGLIQKLAVFEQMERRLEGFTRSGQLTTLFPGGTGTFEEMLYVLAVLMEARNKDLHYTFLLAGSEQNREYYDIVLKTLEQALGKEAVDAAGLRDRICIGTPEEVGQRIIEEAEKAQKARQKEMLAKPNDPNVRMDFHGDIHIPSGLRVPFKVTREAVKNLKLDREQSPTDTIVNLRRFVYTVTCACVSGEKEEVRKNGPYDVQGDPEFLKAVDLLMEYFVRTKRMNGGTYEKPYKVVTA